MSRLQARRRDGQWTRNTPENTFGFHLPWCPHCNGAIPHDLGTKPPDTCHHCGAALVWERCALGRCREAFPDPFVFQRGGYTECGKPAVACEVATRWGQCEEHVGVAKLCVKCRKPITEPQLRGPALGCGGGGLTWSSIWPFLEQAADRMPNVETHLYEPHYMGRKGPKR